jgi:hypothetical protein
MTPNEITTLISTRLNKTFDTPFQLQLIKRVDIWRSRHIKNALEKDVRDRKFFRQTIYLNMNKQSELPCDNGIIPSCDVAVSSKIPSPLRANNILFDYVGGVNGSNPFKETSAGMISYTRAGKYSKNVTPFAYVGNKIQVYNRPNLPMIRVDYIADSPFDLEAFSCNPDATPCNFWETPYPCTNEILQLIIQSIVEIDFGQKEVPDEISVPVNAQSDIQR